MRVFAYPGFFKGVCFDLIFKNNLGKILIAHLIYFCILKPYNVDVGGLILTIINPCWLTTYY